MRNNYQIKRRRTGFTLLEVLLVLVILGVIAALVVPNLIGSQERAMVRATKISLIALEQSLEMYALEHNSRYPESLDDLLHPVDLDGKAMKPYEKEFPKDAWGQRLNYELVPGENEAEFAVLRIWSNGADGQNDDGSGDDINNWSELESSQ